MGYHLLQHKDLAIHDDRGNIARLQYLSVTPSMQSQFGCRMDTGGGHAGFKRPRPSEPHTGGGKREFSGKHTRIGDEKETRHKDADSRPELDVSKYLRGAPVDTKVRPKVSPNTAASCRVHVQQPRNRPSSWQARMPSSCVNKLQKVTDLKLKSSLKHKEKQYKAAAHAAKQVELLATESAG